MGVAAWSVALLVLDTVVWHVDCQPCGVGKGVCPEESSPFCCPTFETLKGSREHHCDTPITPGPDTPDPVCECVSQLDKSEDKSEEKSEGTMHLCAETDDESVRSGRLAARAEKIDKDEHIDNPGPTSAFDFKKDFQACGEKADDAKCTNDYPYCCAKMSDENDCEEEDVDCTCRKNSCDEGYSQTEKYNFKAEDSASGFERASGRHGSLDASGTATTTSRVMQDLQNLEAALHLA